MNTQRAARIVIAGGGGGKRVLYCDSVGGIGAGVSCRAHNLEVEASISIYSTTIMYHYLGLVLTVVMPVRVMETCSLYVPVGLDYIGV